MSPLEIRPATLADYAAVESIMAQVHRLHVVWRPDTYAPCNPVLPQDFFAEAAASGLFFVAVADGAIAGLMHCIERHIARPGQVTRSSLYIETLAVDEQYRGQGIGTALMAFAKSLAEARGMAAVELQVNARNEQARRFYVRLGYTEKSINMEMKC